ncbi:hypothetical protein LZ32DRAFT_270153 [Colletotrichum eremochloae]|nr:hypothetical protein LZ32DRAFT_270153 [Colletotrichum eremochloae]
MRFQKAVDDANTEIMSLQEKVQALSENCDNERRKHEELAYAYKEKCRKLTQVQELYDRVKRKVDLGQMEAAALGAIESSLRYGTYAPDFDLPEPPTRSNIYETQTGPVNYDTLHSIGPDRGNRQANAGKGPGALREDSVWSKSGSMQGRPANNAMLPTRRLMAVTGNVIQTPCGTPLGHGTKTHTRPGQLTASGLAASTHGLSGVHENATNPRHPPVPHGYGLGVGLSSGIRTSHIRHGKHGSRGSRGPMDHIAARPSSQGACWPHDF